MSKDTSADAFLRTLANSFTDYETALDAVIETCGIARTAPRRIYVIDKLSLLPIVSWFRSFPRVERDWLYLHF
jgi:hypothetical protein